MVRPPVEWRPRSGRTPSLAPSPNRKETSDKQKVEVYNDHLVLSSLSKP